MYRYTHVYMSTSRPKRRSRDTTRGFVAEKIYLYNSVRRTARDSRDLNRESLFVRVQRVCKEPCLSHSYIFVDENPYDSVLNAPCS